jgi:hypothetical protein
MTNGLKASLLEKLLSSFRWPSSKKVCISDRPWWSSWMSLLMVFSSQDWANARNHKVHLPSFGTHQNSSIVMSSDLESSLNYY